jgi:transcriptional regulator with XRE-family HTH domain
MLLPKELRSRRIALGLSLNAMATFAGVEPSLLAAMESGDATITPAVIAALSRLEGERHS